MLAAAGSLPGAWSSWHLEVVSLHPNRGSYVRFIPFALYVLSCGGSRPRSEALVYQYIYISYESTWSWVVN